MPKSTKTADPPIVLPARVEGSLNPAQPKGGTKIAIVLDLLRRPGGATIADMAAATGWQTHSVSGALSGPIKKKLCLTIVTEATEAGRSYRLATSDAAA